MKKTTLALLCGLGIVVPSAVATDKISAATMISLEAAFNGESNADARYLGFAEKAADEGYVGTASLFRAAARAEEIHAANHAIVMERSGGAPNAKVELPAVKSTRKNLAAAVKGETYERDEMYPEFIRQAKSDGAGEALRTFSFALAAEAEHARLYADALANLESMTARRVFYVCPTCGFTSSNPNFDRCPTCATPKERFEQVS